MDLLWLQPLEGLHHPIAAWSGEKGLEGIGGTRMLVLESPRGEVILKRRTITS